MRVSDLSNDEFGDEDDGITRDDLKEFATVITECEAGERVADSSLEFRFKQADLDHDGYLSRDEIDKRIEVLEADPTHSYTYLNDDIASLKEIRSRYDSVKSAGPAIDGDKGGSADDMLYYSVGKKSALMYDVQHRVEKHVKNVVLPRDAARLRSMYPE